MLGNRVLARTDIQKRQNDRTDIQGFKKQMRFNQAQTHRLHHHRKGKRLRTNVTFEQGSKVRFTAIIG